MDIGNYAQWGSLFVAGLALGQPWLINAWENRKRCVDIYETGNVELGFSQFGSTLGLHGTLQSVTGDLFVRKIEVRIKRHGEDHEWVFDWSGFRSTRANLHKLDDAYLELPAGFMLRHVEPFRYNIFFTNAALWRRATEHVNSVATAYWEENTRLFGAALDTDQRIPDSKSINFQAYEAISRIPPFTQAIGSLTESLYWQPGNYTLTFCVYTVRPDRSHTATWELTITEEAFRSLRENSRIMLELECQQNSTLNFEYVPYSSAALTRT
jgi:hypothetical protein